MASWQMRGIVISKKENAPSFAGPMESTSDSVWRDQLLQEMAIDD
jgi:hypothetical protein